MYIYKRQPPRRIPLAAGCLALLVALFIMLGLAILNAPPELLAALRGRTPTATPTPATSLTPTREPTTTLRPTRTGTPTLTPLPSATLVPTETPVNFVEHFILARPVPPNAPRIIPAWTYLYGTTERGTQAVHHGEEFVNPIGTPLLATADGTVVAAGNDSEPVCGDAQDAVCGDRPDFYGKLVAIRLDTQYSGQPIYTLCGHMSAVSVQVGQHVRTGDNIGAVGDTGVAIGPHCHFEVRLGVNDYAHTRNPILWMKPLPGRGALAGRVIDRSGNFIRSSFVFLYEDNGAQDYVQDTETYGRDDKPPVNSDDALQENWAMGDLPAGKYLLRVKISGLNYQKHITVQDGKLLFVVFGGE